MVKKTRKNKIRRDSGIFMCIRICSLLLNLGLCFAVHQSVNCLVRLKFDSKVVFRLAVWISLNVCSKLSNTFQIKYWFHKMLSETQTGKNLIRLLLKKQPDLGLRCLSMPFG